MLGYESHAAGDMWAHTMVNYFAGGEWPTDPKAAGAADRILKHMAVEGYIGKRTPAPAGTISIPHDFILRAFIWDRDPDADDPCDESTEPLPPDDVAKGTYFHDFLKQRQALCKFYRSAKDDWYDYLDLKRVAGVYAKAWVRDIDAGLTAWPAFSEQMARAS